MSPARSKRQAPVPHARSRGEMVRAVGAGAGIVIVTALIVWLMRPGPAGIPATGGLMNRQPRSSWLIGIALGVAGLAIWLILRNRRTRPRAKVLIPIALVVALLATVGAGFVWPGGLLRHDVAPEPVPEPTTTTTRPGSPTTKPAGSSTTTPTTAAPTATTTAPASAPTTTSP
jgi:hypothetical protein